MPTSVAGTQTRAPQTRALDEGLLDLEKLPPYLIERDLVTSWDIVHGGLVIEDRCRRNRSFKVHLAGRPGLLVKQADILRTPGLGPILREADIVRAVWETEDLAQLRPYVPRFVDLDEERGVLVTELVHPATSLTRYHDNMADPRFPVAAGVAAARLLATFHVVGGRACEAGMLPRVRRGVHWAVGYRNTFDLMRVPAGIRGVVERLRATTTWEPLVSRVEPAWKRGTDFVHGDARWENFLVTAEDGAKGGLGLKLIDFEMSVQGDAALDVAMWFTDHIRLWTHAARDHQPGTPDDLDALVPWGPARWHDQARAFWSAYAAKRALRGEERKEFLRRVFDHLPMTLLLAAVEGCQGAATSPPVTLTMVDLTERAYQDPARMARRYFGLPTQGWRA